jgi:hypothetical protein
MSETTSTPTGRPVKVTYRTERTVTIYVQDSDFLADTVDLGAVARANLFSEARFGPKMTGYIDRHRGEFAEIPNDAEIVYVDPQADAQ